MNIYGIGTDIVEIERLASKLTKEAFVSLVFTEEEMSYCRSRKHSEESFAARFAAKEAFMKAMGTGWSEKCDFKEIEVKNGPSGQPVVILHGLAKSHFENSGLKEIFVSLSHTTAAAVAFVIITK